MPVFAYLKIDGIVGESQAQNFTGQIECQSVSFEISNVTTTANPGGGAAVGKTIFGPMVFTKAIDSVSPQIFLALAQGKHEPIVTLSLVQSATKAVYATVSLRQIVFLSQETAVSGGIGAETVKIAYASLEYSVSSQAPDGSLNPPVLGGWDVTQNRRL